MVIDVVMKNYVIFILSTMIVIWNRCYSDIAFNHLKSFSLHIFRETSKYWNAYLKKFISQKLINEQYSYVYLVQILYQGYLQTQQFKNISKRLIESHQFKETYNKKWKAKTQYFIMSWTTARVYINSAPNTDHTFILLFNVNNNLTINITFYTLNLRVKPGEKLYGLTVIKVSSHAECLQHRSELNNIKHKYSLNYATFNLYPKFKLFCLRSIGGLQNKATSFQLDAQFSVADNLFITSENIVMKKSEYFSSLVSIVPFHSYLILKIFLCPSYHIKARKYHQIIFSKFNYEVITIFDGPGFIYPTLRPIKQVYLTSTFQCVIQLYNSTLNDMISISVRVIPEYTYLYVNRTTHFNYPEASFSKVLCSMKLESGSEYQINFTITNIQSLIPIDIGCLFWGVATVEFIGGKYKESNVICSSFNIKTPSRSFYSLNSTLFVIIYAYTKYRFGNVSAIISRTKCKPVHLEPCLLAVSICHSLSKGKSYLSDITKTTGVKLSLLSNIDEDVLFDLENNKCVIIQIGNRPSKISSVNDLGFKCFSIYYSGCHIHISPQTINNIIYHVKGELLKDNLVSDYLIYQMKDLKSNPMLKLKQEIKRKSREICAFESIFSFKGILYVESKSDWFDIIIKGTKSKRDPLKEISNIYTIYQGLNVFPRISEYGPAFFSQHDIYFTIVNHSLASPADITVEIETLFLLPEKHRLSMLILSYIHCNLIFIIKWLLLLSLVVIIHEQIK